MRNHYLFYFQNIFDRDLSVNTLSELGTKVVYRLLNLKALWVIEIDLYGTYIDESMNEIYQKPSTLRLILMQLTTFCFLKKSNKQ